MCKIQNIAKEEGNDPVAEAKAMVVPIPRSNTDRDKSGEQSMGPTRRSGTMPVHHSNPFHSVPFQSGAEMPLPCWYFDYMIGTSTGGYASSM